MMQEKPAHTIDLRSSITTWASKTFPVLMGLVRLHMTKPGESSSSEIPFTLALIFSPEVTAVTSMSSDQICSILTSLYDGYGWLVIFSPDRLSGLTLLGMINKVSPFLQQPLSTFPITMVPMSLYLGRNTKYKTFLHRPSCLNTHLSTIGIMKGPST